MSGRYGDLEYEMLCNTMVLSGKHFKHRKLKSTFEHKELPAKPLEYFLRSNKSNINQWVKNVMNPGVSLGDHPILRYFPKDTKLGLGTLLELHYILQCFCVCQEDGGEGNRGTRS